MDEGLPEFVQRLISERYNEFLEAGPGLGQFAGRLVAEVHCQFLSVH